MKIERISLYQVKLEFKKEFSASWGSFKQRFPTLVQIESEGICGWGEAAALPLPYYGHEDSQTVFHMLSKHMCQMVMESQPQNIEQLNTLLGKIKLNNIAKSGLEMAYWDLLAKRAALPLHRFLGGSKSEIECGATLSSGLKSNELEESALCLINEGYKKLRIKIRPDTELSVLRNLISKVDPKKIALDANGCFTLKDLDYLLALDELGVLYIEQPLNSDDFIANSELQQKLKTAICLDESIYSLQQAKLAIFHKSANAFSLKSARVGGHSHLLDIYKLCQQKNIKVVAGGMFESGIGRAHALAVASLEDFELPAAFTQSSYYYEQDIIEPEFKFSRPGVLALTDKAGIGVIANLDLIKSRSVNFTVL